MSDRVKNAFVTGEAIVRNTQETSIVAAGTVITANGNVGPFDVSNCTEGEVVIDITAVSGTTPTINFFFEQLDFQSGKYVLVASAGTIAQQTGVATIGVPVTNFGENVRLRYVVGGTTPSFTLGASFIGKS